MPIDRRTALLNQPSPPAVTGIDFVRVRDPHDQHQLDVYFLVDPQELLVTFAAAPIAADKVAIVSVSGGQPVTVVSAELFQGESNTPGPGDPTLVRNVLRLTCDPPGDFSRYRLTIDDARVDRFFNGVELSFKQGCPTGLDCAPAGPDCPTEAPVDFPVDYLARDFTSLVSALTDFAAQRYPDWLEKIPADVGMLLAELLAATGDELGYVQDRYAREAFLESATQRRSIRRHARLVDYELYEGRAAHTMLDLAVVAGGGVKQVLAGNRVWSPAAGGAGPIPFEIGDGLVDLRDDAGLPNPKSFWLHEDWNELHAHVPDEGAPCLPCGATEIYVRGWVPTLAQIPPGADPTKFWNGKWLLLRADPSDPSLPARRLLVQVVATEQTFDPLVIDPTTSTPIQITRIAWDPAQKLPFELSLPDTVVHANLVPATAGETAVELFTIGAQPALDPALAPSAVEREGPHDAIANTRAVTYLYSLSRTETDGLGWVAASGDAAQLAQAIGVATAAPEVELEEIDPIAMAPFIPPRLWRWHATLLDADPLADAFTLDDGIWRRVVGYRNGVDSFVHRDYASGAGFTIRFGDGEFGKSPLAGTVFRTRYRIGPGTRANLAADTVTRLVNPTNPAVFDAVAAQVSRATNPLVITGGDDPEPVGQIKMLAPAAFRAVTFRAVREEDFREIAERLSWVQRAAATFRWTGSWLSAFVTADPHGAFELTDAQRDELVETMDCVRQAGREVIVQDPVYLDLDVEVTICVEPTAYAGQVKERVIAALHAFFDPDRFTFGTPLVRAALEGAVQAVAGVLGVEGVRLRPRSLTELRPFSELVFEVTSNQILRVEDDPRFPERGTLRVEAMP